ncbi:MAG: glycosyltransferase family 2 protein [Actinomycetota bacterium]|nr:glycosyltransferase family 2 protein [Actinomycetota bacterium]
MVAVVEVGALAQSGPAAPTDEPARTDGSVTACVLTLNEAPRIGQLVSSLSWADRVLVVDAGSTDGTAELARSNGADVAVHAQRDFASQRNFALTLVDTAWVFWPDADWRLAASVGSAVREAVRRANVDGYEVSIHNVFCGEPLRHGPTGPEYKLRLHRVCGAQWTGVVHEQLALPGGVKRLDLDVLHDHTTDFSDRLAKVVRDASLRARELRASGYRFRLRDLFWRPARRAGGNLVLRAGALDGSRGWVFWGMRGVETFLALAQVWAAEQADKQAQEPGAGSRGAR